MAKSDKPKREEALRVGQKMRRAMEAEGLHYEDLCSTLGWKNSTLYRYFNGDILIPANKLREFAIVVRRPLEWFYAEGNDDQLASDVAAVLLRILGRVVAGRHIEEAFDLETGQPLGLSLTDREALRGAEPALLRELQRLAGRPLDQLSPAEAQDLLRSLLGSPPGDQEGRRGGASTNPRSLGPIH